MYGPVRTVVWEGRSREAPPYPDLRYGPSGDTPPAPRLRQQLWALRPGLDGGVPAVHDVSRDAADRRIRDGAPDRNRRLGVGVGAGGDGRFPGRGRPRARCFAEGGLMY